jgi:hypothetical protein
MHRHFSAWNNFDSGPEAGAGVSVAPLFVWVMIDLLLEFEYVERRILSLSKDSTFHSG